VFEEVMVPRFFKV